MTAEAPDRVTLLYRADQTSLSLAADVSVTSDHDLAELRAERGSGRPARSSADAWEVATERQETEVSRSTLLIAPGGPCRHQNDGFLRGCDGDRSWRVCDGDAPVAELVATPRRGIRGAQGPRRPTRSRSGPPRRCGVRSPTCSTRPGC